MKRNHIMRTSAIVLALVLATACLVSGTFAKYTTTMGGKDTARVAYFEFGSDVLGVDQTAEINLWDTYNDPEVYGDSGNVGADGMKILAPGTWGKIDFNLWGKAEVDTWVDFDLTLTTDERIPLIFTLDAWNGDFVSLPDDFNFAASPVFSDYYPKNTYVTLTKPIHTGGEEFTYVPSDATNDTFLVYIVGNFEDMSKGMDKFLPAGTALEDYSPYENLTWFWCFEEWDGTSVEAGDDRDTALGNNAVNVTGDRENGRDYAINPIKAVLDVNCTVTQID